MKDESYVEALNEAVRILQRAEIDVFNVVVQVAFDGPYNATTEFSDPCDALEMELPLFEQNNDPNLSALAGVVKHLCQIRKRLISENALNINLDDE
jgi:hypothetical protein